MRLPEVFMALLMFAAAAVANADPIDLKPFRATYIAEWKGITAAGSTIELKNVSSNIYTYSSVNSARGIFRMAFPDALSQTSTFKIVDGRVVPMLFQGSDEKSALSTSRLTGRRSASPASPRSAQSTSRFLTAPRTPCRCRSPRCAIWRAARSRARCG